MKFHPAQADISYILMKLELGMILCANVGHWSRDSHQFQQLHLDEEEEAHEVVVGVPAAALYDVHILAPNRVVDVNIRLSWNMESGDLLWLNGLSPLL